jgi:carboxymethylenebutenolidase
MQDQSSYQVARAEFVPIGDGKRGYYAVPQGDGPFPAVLVYQEAFGINGYMESEVRRLAEHGYAAIAPDLFDGETFSYDQFDKVMPKLQTMTDDVQLGYVKAALAFLDGEANVTHDAYGAVGFCMGGRLAFLTSVTYGDKIAAASSFYGGGIAPDQPRHFKPLLDRVPDVKGELLLNYGADDEGITPQEHARLAEALSREKKRYTLSVYPGAPHGFASVDRSSYRRDQAETAWAETLAMFDRTLR